MVEGIVGRSVEGGWTYRPRERAADAKPLLTVSHLGLVHDSTDVSFEVLEGEIVGLAGLMGSGRTELAQCLFGIAKADAGSISVRGRSVDPGDTRAPSRPAWR